MEVGGQWRLPLARPATELPDAERLRDIATGRLRLTRRRGRLRSELEVTDTLVRRASLAARAACYVDTGRIEPADATSFAADLEQVLVDINRLRERLPRRGRE